MEGSKSEDQIAHQSSLEPFSRRGLEFESSVFAAIGDAEVDQNPSSLLAFDFIMVSLAHFKAIQSVYWDHPFSTLALYRPQVEACVRGLYALAKGDAFAAKFTRDLADGETEERMPIRISRLLSEISENQYYKVTADTIARYWKNYSTALHGYVHGGRIMAQLAASGIEQGRLQDLLNHSQAMAAIAFLMLTEISNASDSSQRAVSNLVDHLYASLELSQSSET